VTSSTTFAESETATGYPPGSWFTESSWGTTLPL
jgi:hypothetical protein